MSQNHVKALRGAMLHSISLWSRFADTSETLEQHQPTNVTPVLKLLTCQLQQKVDPGIQLLTAAQISQ